MIELVNSGQTQVSTSFLNFDKDAQVIDGKRVTVIGFDSHNCILNLNTLAYLMLLIFVRFLFALFFRLLVAICCDCCWPIKSAYRLFSYKLLN